jgi:putative DNA primase/helicase
LDLDGCRPNGSDEPWAEEIIRELNSYGESSPSGSGVHVIVKGELPDGPRQKDFKDREHPGLGLYDAVRGRYLTMTGIRLNGNGTIAERTAELGRIHARLFPPKPKASPKRSKADASASDDELIARALKAKDGGKFRTAVGGPVGRRLRFAVGSGLRAVPGAGVLDR